MAATVSELQARLSVDQSSRAKFNRDMSSADKKMADTSKSGSRSFAALARAAKYGFAAAGAAVGAATVYSIKSASDLNESVNAVRVVFGKASRDIFKFGKTAADSAGLSQRAFNEAATPIGASLINVGQSAQDAATNTVALTQRAADMASVFNVDVSEALMAIQAGLRGEADPLERFGVGLNQASVEAYAVKHGIADANTELTRNQTVTARLGLLMEQTNRVQGDFKNTSGGLANQQRILRARLENSAAAIGTVLLPMATKLVGYLNKHVIPVIDQFAGFLEGISKQKTTALKIRFVWEGISGLVEKILFGTPAKRVRVPVDQRHFEWVIEGGDRGLVGAIADAIRAIDWVQVGRSIAVGIHRGATGFLKSVDFPSEFEIGPSGETRQLSDVQRFVKWLGLDPHNDYSTDVLKWGTTHGLLDIFPKIEGEAQAATMGVEESFRTHLGRAGDAARTFSGAMNEHMELVQRDTDRSSDRVENLRGAIERLKSKTVHVTADVSGLSTTAALAEHLALINQNRNIHVNVDGSGDGLIGVGGGSGPSSISPTLFDDLGLANAMGLALSSGFRPGAITLTGNPSLHGVFPSKAIDVSGSAGAMNSFFWREVARGPLTGIRELIHNPYAWYPGAGLVNIAGTQLGRDHVDHVHVGSYDQGGFLRPGWNLAYNGLGRPEPVGSGSIYLTVNAGMGTDGRHVGEQILRALEDWRRRGGR